MHLVRNAYGLDVVALDLGHVHHLFQTQFGIVPPHLRVLLCPAGFDGQDRGLFFGIKG